MVTLGHISGVELTTRIGGEFHMATTHWHKLRVLGIVTADLLLDFKEDIGFIAGVTGD